MKFLIKHQWTAKQQAEVLKLLDDFKVLLYEEEIWSQVDNKTQHPKHEARCKVAALIMRVKKMRKVTEEY